MSTNQRRDDLLVAAHIELGSPRVVHCKRERHHAYVGRPGPLGNMFVIGRDGTREECIAQFEQRAREDEELMRRIMQLRGQVVGCWCAPRACHGDVIVRLANE